MAGDWFYVSDETELGPLSREQLQNLLASGEIGADTPVRKRSWMEWYPAKECLSGGRRSKNLRDEVEAEYQEPVSVASHAQTDSSGLVQSKEFFECYLSPIELFQLEEVAVAERLDAKAIQRAKNRLSHELRLNDRKVPWLDDYTCDEAQALRLEAELHDEATRRYHCAIFENKPLLGFLTRGDIGLFLLPDDDCAHDRPELLCRDPGFRAFLSKRFARQYNRVLARAIENRLLPVVEALFADGWRWVEPKDEDTCFEGAHRCIGELVDRVKDRCEHMANPSEIDDFVREQSYPELFNLLPTHFAADQNEIVAEIRGLALKCNNVHHAPELAREILRLCERFTFRDEELKDSLKADFKAVDEIISEDSKHSFSALVRPGYTVDITRSGIRYANESVNSTDVQTVRWGILIRTVNGVKREHSFSLVVGGAHNDVRVQWDMRGLLGDIRNLLRRNNIVSIADLTTVAQQAHFEQMIGAILHNLVPRLLTKLLERLESGQSIVVGPCILSGGGVAFTTGLFFQKNFLLSWKDVDTQLSSGEIFVVSRTDRGARVSMSAKDTDNAVILPMLCSAMRPRAPAEQSQHGQEAVRRPQVSSNKRTVLGLLAAAAVITIIVISSVNSTSTTPNSGSTPPPIASRQPPYNLPATHEHTWQDDEIVDGNGPPPTPSAAPASEPNTVNRVPATISSELERESQAIDWEKSKAEAMAKQLEVLGGEIKQREPYLDRTSQFDVEEFNRKVDAYNALLEQVRAQNRVVNQLVDRYNEKLQKNGR